MPEGQESTSKPGPVVRVRLLISCVPGLLGSGLPRQPQPCAGSGCGGAGWPGHGGSCSPSPAEGQLLPAPGSAQGHEPVPCRQRGSGARNPWGPCPTSARTRCCPLGPDPTQLRHRGAGNRLTPICSWWELHQSGAVYCIRGMLPSNQLSGRPSPDLLPTLAGLCACQHRRCPHPCVCRSGNAHWPHAYALAAACGFRSLQKEREVGLSLPLCVGKHWQFQPGLVQGGVCARQERAAGLSG